MKIKVKRNNVGIRYWSVFVDGFMLGGWPTPREARHKGRMWCMWLNTGDHKYLRA